MYHVQKHCVSIQCPYTINLIFEIVSLLTDTQTYPFTTHGILFHETKLTITLKKLILNV